MAEVFEHGGRHYVVQFHYALPDDAWCIELSEALPAPESWSEIPDASTHLPGPALIVAVVPDEDPSAEPTVRICGRGEHTIPYAVMRWFMDIVGEQVEHCSLAMPSDAEAAARPGAA